MSTLTNELGLAPIIYDRGVNWGGNAVPTFSSSQVMGASGTKLAVVGCVWHPTTKTGTINIRKVHYRAGAVTSAGASTVKVSLASVSATAGPPYQPGTLTENVTFNASAITQNGWNTTAALSADRAVDLSADSIGDANSRWVAVVYEFATYGGADSVVISCMTESGQLPWGSGGDILVGPAGVYGATANRLGNVVLECDDGTFAFLYPNSPWASTSTASIANNAAIRAAGLYFSVPTTRKLCSFGLHGAIANGCDGTLILYDTDGTTVLVSVDLDNDAVLSTSQYMFEATFAPVTLTAGSFYRAVYVATTATAAVLSNISVNAAGHMDGANLGQNAQWTQRDSAGAWSQTATMRPVFSLGFSAFHDGTGSGGGMRLAGAGGLAAG